LTSEPRRAPLAVALAVAVLGLTAPSAESQCLLTGPPVVFDPPPGVDTSTFGSGMAPLSWSVALYKNANGRRVVTQYSYGYAVYDLAWPESPRLLTTRDIHANPNFAKHGDGQFTVNAVGSNADGSMLLVNYSDQHGTLVMPPGTGGAAPVRGVVTSAA
jgi:hypothetical protein